MKQLFLILFILTSTTCLQAQISPNRFENSIRNFEKQDSILFPEKGVVLFTGSSSIAMWRDIADYFPEHKVLNRGFGGSEFSDLLYYKERVIYPYKPSKIFIYEGDNDLNAGESVASIMEEARELRKAIKKALPGVPVVFISVKPSISRWHLKQQYEELNKCLEEYAEKTKNTEFADVWTPMLKEDGEVKEHLFIEDGLHMNAEGYKLWKEALLPFIE